ncbi:MAG: DUF2848 family protein [Bacillota bacterium]
MEFFIDGDANRSVTFGIQRIVNAGFAGRNQEAVWKHIEELVKIGVPRPTSTPTFYPLLPDKITQAESLEVVGRGNSGEVEFVLFCQPEGLLVGLGSDHTDRELEKASILKSKQVYPNIVAKSVWRYEDVRDHWDQLIIRAWVGGENKQLYQEAKLSALIPPEELLPMVEKLLSVKLDGTAVFSGTVATLTEDIEFSDFFAMELEDPIRKQVIKAAYRIKPIDWFLGPVD